MVTLAAVLAVMVGLSAVTTPVAARYLPTKRSDNERLDRLAHLIKELLAESDAAPLEHPAYDQRVFYKREAPFPGDAKLGEAAAAAAPGPAHGGEHRAAAALPQRAN